jgi:hypothetical protein
MIQKGVRFWATRFNVLYASCVGLHSKHCSDMH